MTKPRTAMTCRQTILHLLDYAEGRLEARKRKALEAHLVMCLRCVEFLDSYRRTPAIVRRATNATLPPTIARRLRRALRRRKS